MVRKDEKLEPCSKSTKRENVLQSDATKNGISATKGRIEFTDDFMFATIMGQEQEICRKVLECILGFEIESLSYVESQNTIKNGKRAKGTKGDISDELREFIRYIEQPDEVAKSLHTDFIKQIEEKVIEENDNEDWRKSHMTWEMQMKELKHEGREEGRKEGRKEGLTVGLVRGEKRGLDIATKIFRLFRDGKSEGQIASTVGIDVATVRRVLG